MSDIRVLESRGRLRKDLECVVCATPDGDGNHMEVLDQSNNELMVFTIDPDGQRYFTVNSFSYPITVSLEELKAIVAIAEKDVRLFAWDGSRPYTEEQALSQFVDRELSAVSFVRDYVELHFDGYVIRFINDPELICDGTCYRFPDDAFRVAICKLIGIPLKTFAFSRDRVLVLDFSIGTLSVSLSRERFGEALHLVTDGGLDVW